MIRITKAVLSNHAESLGEAIKKYDLNSRHVYGYGYICDQYLSATHDLNLLIQHRDLEENSRLGLQKKISTLLQANIAVDTLKTLRDKSVQIKGIEIPIPSEMISHIQRHSELLDNLILQGQANIQEAEELSQKIEILIPEPNGIYQNRLSDFTPDQIELFIELGNRHRRIMGERPNLSNNVFALLNDKQRLIVDYAKQWDIHYACINKRDDILKVILDRRRSS